MFKKKNYLITFFRVKLDSVVNKFLDSVITTYSGGKGIKIPTKHTKRNVFSHLR